MHLPELSLQHIVTVSLLHHPLILLIPWPPGEGKKECFGSSVRGPSIFVASHKSLYEFLPCSYSNREKSGNCTGNCGRVDENLLTPGTVTFSVVNAVSGIIALAACLPEPVENKRAVRNHLRCTLGPFFGDRCVVCPQSRLKHINHPCGEIRHRVEMGVAPLCEMYFFASQCKGREPPPSVDPAN